MPSFTFFYGLGVHELGKPWGFAIATYLFLGGLAGGAYLAGYSMSLLKTKTDFSRSVEKFGIISSGIILIVGLLSLILDHPNVINAVFNPFLFRNLNSWLAIGSWIILFFLIIWFILVVESRKYIKIPEKVKLSLMSANAFLAFMVILYTALLLRGARFVPLWESNAIPLLFVVSGISTGLAICLVYGIFRVKESDERIKRADALLIVIEILLVGYLLWDLGNIASSAGYRFMRIGAEESLNLLLNGNFSMIFLVGFIGIGLLLPLALYLISFLRKTEIVEVLSGFSVLVGGYLFRIIIIAVAAKAIVLP